MNTLAAFEIVKALHFDQPRSGASESFQAVSLYIELIRQGGCGTDELGALVIECIDQQHETARFVSHRNAHLRNVVYQNGMKILSNCQIVGCRQWLCAQTVSYTPRNPT